MMKPRSRAATNGTRERRNTSEYLLKDPLSHSVTASPLWGALRDGKTPGGSIYSPP